MLSQEEISRAAHTAAVKAMMPIDMQLTVASGIYRPPDEEARPVIRIRLRVTDPDSDDYLETEKIIQNILTEEILEVYLLGYIQGMMETLEEAELRNAMDSMGDSPSPFLH